MAILAAAAVLLWAFVLTTEGDLGVVQRNPMGFWRDFIMKWAAPVSSLVAMAAILLTWQNVLIAKRHLTLKEAEEERSAPRLDLDYTTATVTSQGDVYHYLVLVKVTNRSSTAVAIADCVLEFSRAQHVGPPIRVVLSAVDPATADPSEHSSGVNYLVAPFTLGPHEVRTGSLYVRVGAGLFGTTTADEVVIRISDSLGNLYSLRVGLITSGASHE